MLEFSVYIRCLAVEEIILEVEMLLLEIIED